MNALQKLVWRLVGGEKALYDLYPDLRYRIPVWREYADAARAMEDDPTSYYGAHTWVHKAISLIATNIAPLELQVVRDGEAVDRHPLARLLQIPNPTISASALWREWTVNMLLYGEHGFELVRTRRGEYAEMWPRSADQFAVRVAKDGRRYRKVMGYRIDDGAGDPYDLPPEEFLHILFFNPSNPFRGMSPISAVRTSLALDALSQEWARMFFANAATPLLAVIAPQGLTAAERAELEAKFTARYAGIEHAHGIVAVEEGVVDVKPLSFPPRDIEWLEQRKMAREEIGAIFGVPDELMGWGRDTYENFRQAIRAFWQLTLLPLVRLRDDHLTNFFRRVGVLGNGEVIQTDLAAVEALQEDKADKVMQAQTLFGMGVPLQTIDELLDLGIGPLDGANVGYLPLNLMPVTHIPGTEAPEREEPEPEPAQEPAQERAWKAWEFGSDEHKASWLLFKARAESWERALLRTAKRAFQEQQNRIAANVRGLSDPSKLSLGAVWNGALEGEAWVEAFRPTYTEIIRDGLQHGMEFIGYTRRLGVDSAAQKQGDEPLSTPPGAGAGVEVILARPDVQAAITAMLWDFAEEVQATTQALLEELFRQALEEGWSIPRISDALAELYSEFKGPRAERIARTEAVKAYNYGTNEAYKEAGIKRRRWIAALDERTRATHLAAHGQVRRMDEPFAVGGSELMFPGDPSAPPGEVVNCRCTIVPVFEED